MYLDLPFRFDFWKAVVPIGIVFSVACQLVATSCGLGFTYDSFIFLDGARYVSESNLANVFDHWVFQIKPPLFVLTLSLINYEYLRLFYTAMLIANLVAVAYVIDIYLNDKLLRSVAFISISAFTPLVMIHVYIWIEPVLFLFFMLSAIFFARFVKGQRTRDLIALIVFSILLTMTKHAGIFLVLGYVIALFFNTGVKKQKSLILFFIGSSGFLIWNFLLKFNGFSERLDTLKLPIQTTSFERLGNVYSFLNAASLWLLPHSFPEWLRISIFLLLIIIVGFFVYKKAVFKSKPLFKSLLIIVFTYYILMHAALTIEASEAERYLVLIYPLAVIIALGILQELRGIMKGKFSYVLLLILLWMTYPIMRMVKNTVFWKQKICVEQKLNKQHIGIRNDSLISL